MRKSTSRGQLSTGHVPLGLELLGQEGFPTFWVVKRQGETERGKEKKRRKRKEKERKKGLRVAFGDKFFFFPSALD